MTRRSYEIAERRMWRDAFCAVYSLEHISPQSAAECACDAVAEFRKRYPAPEPERDDDSETDAPIPATVRCAACLGEIANPLDVVSHHNARIEWRGMKLCLNFTLCKSCHYGAERVVPDSVAIAPAPNEPVDVAIVETRILRECRLKQQAIERYTAAVGIDWGMPKVTQLARETIELIDRVEPRAKLEPMPTVCVRCGNYPDSKPDLFFPFRCDTCGRAVNIESQEVRDAR